MSNQLDHRDDPYGTQSIDVDPDKVLGEQKEFIDIGESQLIRDGNKMAFSGEVAEEFEEKVISRQIPGYDSMRHRISGVVDYYLKPNTTFADLGTSQGRTIRDEIAHLIATKDSRASNVFFIGADYEADMVEATKKRLAQLLEKDDIKKNLDAISAKTFAPVSSFPKVSIQEADLRNGASYVTGSNCSVITSILTLQFIPVEHRPHILKDIYEALEPGGAFILVEKVLMANASFESTFTEMYYRDKQFNGVKSQDIIEKRRSLEGVLVPLTERGNIELLENAGFKRGNIAEFWSDLAFKGWVAVK